MKLLTKSEAAPATSRQGGLLNSFRRRLVAVVATMAAIFCGLVGPASAAPLTTDPAPTGAETSITSGFAQLQSLVTGTLGIALFAIVVAGLGIAMGIRWLRKGAHSA